MSGPYMQIGEVAALTELSLRTIRHYEEVGLVVPSGRSQGGFRLYVRDDVDRLLLVRKMKRLFTLDEMRDVLEVIDTLTADEPLEPEERSRLLGRLREVREAALAQVRTLQQQVDRAQAFAAELDELDRTVADGGGARRDGLRGRP